MSKPKLTLPRTERFTRTLEYLQAHPNLRLEAKNGALGLAAVHEMSFDAKAQSFHVRHTTAQLPDTPAMRTHKILSKDAFLDYLALFHPNVDQQFPG